MMGSSRPWGVSQGLWAGRGPSYQAPCRPDPRLPVLRPVSLDQPQTHHPTSQHEPAHLCSEALAALPRDPSCFLGPLLSLSQQGPPARLACPPGVQVPWGGVCPAALAEMVGIMCEEETSLPLGWSSRMHPSQLGSHTGQPGLEGTLPPSLPPASPRHLMNYPHVLTP